MKEYNVKQISEILETNPETVRRWIRSGKLEAVQNSKKGGNVISEEALLKFLKDMPKYSGIVGGALMAASPVVGLPLVMGTLASGIAAALLTKKETRVNAAYIRSYLNQEKGKLQKSIEKKRSTVEQLQADIVNEEQRIQELTYALEHLDLDEIAENINQRR